MTCEKIGIDITTGIAIAANKLAEAKTAPGSDRHVSAMQELLDRLHKPGALDVLTGVVKNGQTKMTAGLPVDK